MSVKKIVPGTTRLGWIGTGVMGQSMCGHLIAKGFAATVYNRTQGQGPVAARQGRNWAATPKQVAEQSDVVFAIVGFPTRRARSLPRRRRRAGRQQGRQHPRRYDHERAVAGGRDLRRGQGQGRSRRRCPGLRRRRRRARSAAVDHDRRRQGSRRSPAALLGGDGQDDHPSRRRRRGPAHQDGQPDADRQRT